jgi:endonuclease III
MLDLNKEELLNHFKTLNYYKTKTENIIKTCQILLEKFAGQVPNKMSDLTSLPGVGNKTANVIMLQAFGKNAIAVDTHVGRLSNRLDIVKSQNPDVISKQLLKMADKKQVRAIHHLFVLHGRYVCKKIKPLCNVCKINHLCSFHQKSCKTEAVKV